MQNQTIYHHLQSYRAFLTLHCFSVTISLMILNCIVAIISIVLIPDSPIRKTQEELWSKTYFELVMTSVWVALPMAIDIFLNFYKELYLGEIPTCVLWRVILIFSLIVPEIIQSILPYNSNPQLAWEIQTGLHLSQVICIISSLFMAMFRKGKIHKRQATGQFDIIASTVHTMIFMSIFLFIFLLQCLMPEVSSLGILVAVSSVISLSYLIYAITKQMILLLSELVDNRFQSHETLNDFLLSLILALYLLSFVVIFTMEFDTKSNPAFMVQQVLVSRYKVIAQIIFTVLLTVVPLRVAAFHARLEGKLLMNKLNTIRYVSHEMRTPLNTVYLSVQYAQDQLTALQTNS